MEKLNSCAFEYWVDGNKNIKVNPILNKGNVLYVVRVSGRSWIPCNVIVFALNKSHAKRRVLKAIEICSKKDYKSDRRKYKRDKLDDIKTGELKVEVKEFDKKDIAHIQWADNDTVF